MKIVLLVFILIAVLHLANAQQRQPRPQRRQQRGPGQQRGTNPQRRQNRGQQRGTGTNPQRRQRPRRVNQRQRPSQATANRRNRRRQCEEIYLPMCRGLVPYTSTLLPNQFGHQTQEEVYRAVEYLWPFMDLGCSRNFRVTVCGYYLPKCPGRGRRRGLKPCKETCNKAKQCEERIEQLGSSWPEAFTCSSLRWKKSKKCIPPVPETPRCTGRHITCERNEHEFCSGLNFALGAVPNMFLQCALGDIHKEMDEYKPLIDSGCSPHLAFLLCGIFTPFCDRPENPFALPCREICDQVQSDCAETYRTLYGGLRWPGKLQCHRYPSTSDTERTCVMPSHTVIPVPEPPQE